MRLTKDVEHVMETLFLIRNEDARELLPRGLTPYTFWGKGLLQLSALKYKDLDFEGRSLGPCTDVYVAIATKLGDKLSGFCVCFYNDSEEVVAVVNRNWFFSKKYAEIGWEINQDHFSVHVTHDEKHILDYGTTILTRFLVLPVLKRTRHASTLSENTIYVFDNVFDTKFGTYTRPKIQAQETLEWIAKLQKRRLYSIIWFNDTLRITDAKPVATRVGDHLKPIPL